MRRTHTPIAKHTFGRNCVMHVRILMDISRTAVGFQHHKRHNPPPLSAFNFSVSILSHYTTKRGYILTSTLVVSSPLQSKTWLETRQTTGQQVVLKTRTAHSLTPSVSGTVGTLTMDLALSRPPGRKTAALALSAKTAQRAHSSKDIAAPSFSKPLARRQTPPSAAQPRGCGGEN